jgi:hypothetical protein
MIGLHALNVCGAETAVNAAPKLNKAPAYYE